MNLATFCDECGRHINFGETCVMVVTGQTVVDGLELIQINCTLCSQTEVSCGP